jgi:hypothetical protein
MKTNITQRRIKARKLRSCGMCKPWKQGWEDKKDHRGKVEAERADQQLRETQTADGSASKARNP